MSHRSEKHARCNEWEMHTIPPLTFLPLLPLLLRSGDHALRGEEDDRAEQEAAPRRPAGGTSATNFHVSGQNCELCTLIQTRIKAIFRRSFQLLRVLNTNTLRLQLPGRERYSRRQRRRGG